VLAGDHIHDCGLLPSRNEDHGIYVQDATNTLIVGNLIDHNTDRGIQFYPSAQGTVVIDNVISNNGEGIAFGGDDGVASSNNTVEHNLIVNSDIRGDVESWYPAGNPIGTGNIVQNNCVSASGINLYDGGFVARNNVTAPAADLVAGENGGYEPATGSACAGMVPEIASGKGAEGTPSGGVPTSSGKTEGGGTTPASGHEGSTSSKPAAPVADAPPVHAKRRHKRVVKHGRARTARSARAHASARRPARAKHTSSAQRRGD
jgi:parallel beta-helix repeat protein